MYNLVNETKMLVYLIICGGAHAQRTYFFEQLLHLVAVLCSKL